ncbi:membrane protein [Pontibacillus halophilus JSM 076056 = DSM 19796]|uniref:Membrane protein n=1 Tax=Pontibacillus halophilus JSM 076056 = DSM 19796 TaxID=1385510 RepID=A0A0A5GHF4_9BACI|nr:membrane protein [Pontibacillus halophilus JSM 076056 = DSM 19796]
MNSFIWFWLMMTILAFFFNIFGMMFLYPIYLTMPCLFVTIFFTVFSIMRRKRFRGFL